MLFAALASVNADTEVMELRMRAYLLALHGVPKEALNVAARQVLDGTAELERPQFAPTPPELARLCRGHTYGLYRTLERLQRQVERVREIPFQQSDASRERIARGFQKLSIDLSVTISRGKGR